MDALSYFFLTLFVIFGLSGAVLSFVGRNREVLLSEFLRIGTVGFYRNVPRYIEKKFIGPFMTCSYLAVGSFLGFLLYNWLRYLLGWIPK